MQFPNLACPRTINQSRPQPPIVLGQPLDTYNRIRPKLPIGPRGELAYVFPTYI